MTQFFLRTRPLLFIYQIFIIGFFVFSTARAQFWGPEPTATCDSAKLDNNIFWSGVTHDSFLESFRKPFGAQPLGSGDVVLRLQTCAADLSSVRIVLWDAVQKERIFLPMRSIQTRQNPKLGAVELWEARVRIPSVSTILYYFFELRDGVDTDYYIDDNQRDFPGGIGKSVDDWDDQNSFQITIYDRNFDTPHSVQGKVAYQIFPDRFRNGNFANDISETNHRWVYGKNARKIAWNQPLCDPYSSECGGEKYNLFYGGDLDGLRQELVYLAEMGVEIVYLNPIFSSPTNHRYDSSDPLMIDSLMGDLADFDRVIADARNLGIQIILDGVFNHVSSDSPYFDLWGRWNSQGQLTSPSGPGTNDQSGACESQRSRFRQWFHIPDIGSPAWNRSTNQPYLCPNPILAGSTDLPQPYESWFGLFNVPKLNAKNSEVQDWIMGAHSNSIMGHWMSHGIGGWRLDVGGDLDPGRSREPWNFFWDTFRDRQKSMNPESWIVGEEWGNPSPWLLGSEWDSAMNYSLRSALLRWVFDRCTGAGCEGGKLFRDNDSNESSPLGPIYSVSESGFARAITGIQEWLPPPALHAMMNTLGTHDTNRIAFLLKKISDENETLARKKLKFLYAFLFAYPGVPTLYYGDEAGISAPGRFIDGSWIDDPYNRAAFPWPDQGLAFDGELRNFVAKLGLIRKSSKVLQTGDFRFVEINDDQRLIAFTRNRYDRFDSGRILVVMNRSERAIGQHEIELGEFQLNRGTQWRDLLTNRSFSQSGSKLVVTGLEPWSFLYLQAE
jgi:glycosidase